MKYLQQIFLRQLLLSVCFALYVATAMAVPLQDSDSLIVRQRQILREKNVDSNEFKRFADACVKRNEADILMYTYRQVIDSGQKLIVLSDLSFLHALDKQMDTGRPSDNNFYIAYLTGRIINKYHLDSVASLRYFERAVRIAQKLNDDCLTIRGYFGISSYYNNIRHDIFRASEYHERINDLLQKTKKDGIVDCNVDNNMGYVVMYYYLEEYGKGIEFLNSSIASAKKINDRQRLFDLYCRRAFLESGLRQYAVGLMTLDSARQMTQNAPSKERMYNYLKADSFNIYVADTNFDKAVLLNRKINVSMLDGVNDEYYDYMLSLVKMNIHFAQYAEAEKNIDTTAATLKAWNLQRWKNIYELKYLLSKAQNHTADALRYYEEYTKYNDTVHHQRQNFAVISEQIKYHTQQKEEALKLQIAANVAQRQRASIIIAISISACLLLLLLLVYRTNADLREKGRLNRSFAQKLIHNTEKEQNRLATELHDGLGQELLLLKNSLVHDNDTLKAAAVGNIIENVRDMSRELYPALLKVAGLKSAMEHQLQKIDEQEDIFISSAIDYEGKLSKPAELQVYRIFQEAITNVLKYAKATSVLVSLKEDGDNVILTVKDNGAGFDADEKMNSFHSFGLQSMQQRAESINAFLRITTSKNKGTEITLNLHKNENTGS